jgi:ribosome-binding factor A
MAQSQRVRRVNESVKEILAEALQAVKDPRIGFVTITDVRTTTDLKHCEVFYTVLPDDEESRARTAEGLRSAGPVLRRELGARLRTRNTPELEFTHDPVPEQGRRIERLLRAEKERGADDGDQ